MDWIIGTVKKRVWCTWKWAQQLKHYRPNKKKPQKMKCQNEFKSEDLWLVAASVTNIFDVDESGQIQWNLRCSRVLTKVMNSGLEGNKNEKTVNEHLWRGQNF